MCATETVVYWKLCLSNHIPQVDAMHVKRVLGNDVEHFKHERIRHRGQLRGEHTSAADKGKE